MNGITEVENNDQEFKLHMKHVQGKFQKCEVQSVQVIMYQLSKKSKHNNFRYVYLASKFFKEPLFIMKKITEINGILVRDSAWSGYNGIT